MLLHHLLYVNVTTLSTIFCISLHFVFFPSPRPLEMQRPPEMTTAVGSGSTSRLASTTATESSAPTWEHICWRNHEWCFRWAHKCTFKFEWTHTRCFVVLTYLLVFHWLALTPLLIMTILFWTGLLNRLDMQHIRLLMMQLPLLWSLLKAQLKSHWPCRVLQSYYLVPDIIFHSCWGVLGPELVLHEFTQF